MNIIKSFTAVILVAVLTACLPLTVSAAPTTGIKMQVITQNLTISKQDVKQVEVLKAAKFPGVKITLTEGAAKKLEQLAESNLQKTLQLSVGDQIINEAVIQGKLGSRFMIATGSEEMAQTIYMSLSS